MDFEQTVSKLKAYLPAYLTEKLGIDPKKSFRCPFPDHEDHSPSASVIGLDTNSPRMVCFGCNRTLDIFDAVVLLEKKPSVGREWITETLNYLAKKYGVEIELPEMTPEQIYELDIYRAYRTAASLIRAGGITSTIFKDSIAERGWDQATLEDYGVGTVESYNSFRSALRKNGFPAQFLDEIDLGRKDLFNENNLIFTWKDENGRPIGFTSRNLRYEEEVELAEQTGVKPGPKYNNQRTTGLKCNIFRKGSRLYGIDTALKTTPPLYLFEGQADAITAKHHGLRNCAAIAGGSLSVEHIHLLQKLNIRDVIICFDGDGPGLEKTKSGVEKFSGFHDMRVRVMEMVIGEDPDSYIRKFGIESFKQLSVLDAFQWRLNQFSEDITPEDICSSMIPLIINEDMAVKRDQLCKLLANHTGVALIAIREDLRALLDQKSKERSDTRRDIIERTKWELDKHPTDAEQTLLAAQTELQEFDKKHNIDFLSSEGFIEAIRTQRELEENPKNIDTSFDLGSDLQELREWMRGEWTDSLIIWGGKESTGKTAMLCKLAWEIANNNDNTIVLYHSTDDSLTQILPRFVCLAVGDLQLTLNEVRQPNYWKKHVANLEGRREYGYARVTEMAKKGRLILKDTGTTLSFAENLIQYHQQANPDARIVYFADNFHKFTDYSKTEERVRTKLLSQAFKNMTTRHHITTIATVEYTKLYPGIKPNKSNILETGQIAYDANFIGHLYSEVADMPDSYTVCHKGTDWKGESIDLPRIEVLVDKNKITERKGKFWLDFWPASSDYRSVNKE